MRTMADETTTAPPASTTTLLSRLARLVRAAPAWEPGPDLHSESIYAFVPGSPTRWSIALTMAERTEDGAEGDAKADAFAKLFGEDGLTHTTLVQLVDIAFLVQRIARSVTEEQIETLQKVLGTEQVIWLLALARSPVLEPPGDHDDGAESAVERVLTAQIRFEATMMHELVQVEATMMHELGVTAHECDTRIDIAKRMAEAIVLLREQTRWIPVAERLPELLADGAGGGYDSSSAVVLMLLGRGPGGVQEVRTGYYEINPEEPSEPGAWFYTGERIRAAPTHWMPTPQTEVL